MISFREYSEKVRGCWCGKAIGGTLGEPFECYKGVVEVDYYTKDISNGAAPNDDLDLQLVWLVAAEKYGKQIDEQILAEYWLSYIVPNWSEYGASKNNLSIGIRPPISGIYNNHNKNSNGSFIRAEIWACLNPGDPEAAVKYAYKDACVDHTDEGVWATLFCAAMLSAAFVENDINKLIDIGLSYIPEDCGTAKAVLLARECAKEKLDWKSARKKLLCAFPSSFGLYKGLHPDAIDDDADVPFGELGYDAPASMGIIVISLLLGEGDFGKSICIATGCCEDADCTAGTVAALLGIIYGQSGIPEKWSSPIGNDIKTMSVDITSLIPIPKTIDDLTKRVCNLMPMFMADKCDVLNQVIETRIDNELFGQHNTIELKEAISFATPIFCGELKFKEGINFVPNKPIGLHIDIQNLIRRQQWLKFRWFLPDGWTVDSGRSFCMNLDQPHGGYGTVDAEFCITPDGSQVDCHTIVLEISSHGRPSKAYIPFVLVSNPQNLIR